MAFVEELVKRGESIEKTAKLPHFFWLGHDDVRLYDVLCDINCEATYDKQLCVLPFEERFNGIRDQQLYVEQPYDAIQYPVIYLLERSVVFHYNNYFFV